MGKLPLEIIDLVITELWRQRDAKGQSACSLVCRAWLQYASDRKFSAIVFEGMTKGDNLCYTLLELIDGRPALARSVRWVFFSEDPEDEEDSDDDDDDDEDEDDEDDELSSVFHEWLQPSLYIAPLLRKLTMLQGLWLNMTLNWATLQADLKSAFYDLFARPTMQSICLRRISDMDISPFVQYAHISELSLRAVSVVPSNNRGLSLNQHEMSPTAVASNLRKCDINATAAAAMDIILKAPNPKLNFRGVARLEVSTDLWDDMTQSVWDRVTEQCVTTLTNLRIMHSVGGVDPSQASPFPFKILDHLRFSSLSTLVLHTKGYLIDNVAGHNILPHFLKALRSLASVGNVLQRLEMQVGYEGEPYWKPCSPCAMQTINKTKDAWPYLFWTELDTVLVSPGFKMFKLFVLEYYTGWNNKDFPCDSLEQSLKELLPQLVKRDMLDGPHRREYWTTWVS
ncbi:hypothetical protein CC2G_003326 [Coprinopsis cinerea AmutBmut pab1-1]|nr:hypothetical protein CC2G_003326 [Coprinopsis cinerea AmutBmut pab1-1]